MVGHGLESYLKEKTMWPFKKKPKNHMKGIIVDVIAYGNHYNALIWDQSNSFYPKIIAAKYNLPTYTEATDEGIRLWNEIRAARIKLYGDE